MPRTPTSCQPRYMQPEMNSEAIASDFEKEAQARTGDRVLAAAWWHVTKTHNGLPLQETSHRGSDKACHGREIWAHAQTRKLLPESTCFITNSLLCPNNELQGCTNAASGPVKTLQKLFSQRRRMRPRLRMKLDSRYVGYCTFRLDCVALNTVL